MKLIQAIKQYRSSRAQAKKAEQYFQTLREFEEMYERVDGKNHHKDVNENHR